ncbi:HopJ type III effector protein [Pseudoalteromonas tunicata]|jgi:hypothetical protein|uniref:Hypothetical cytosolic protein n=1 Tax=Pseudoalteromonas tunicata D2 TaxID=87626 RepID=A4CAQ9_9GAMM|nr:HopJ type III effector protein [Pseudoalteromonas tunicata]ATC95012.1 hypothetical protein PTUN_a2551 [Pseudoalteromonas tunicata]AXT30668.1 type III effector [Pseudoalteromonas tunicata]EAR28467.1 hypothetical cytosolic protein [Pseudoalteromonas tunicata D2]
MPHLLLDELIKGLSADPCQVSFAQSIATIEHYYTFTPTQFSNGQLTNLAGQNNGSCKLFAFALLHQLTPVQTLNLFGDYYHQDVLQHPDGDDHQNIRNFMRFGWSGIIFEAQPLKLRS